MVLAGGGGDAPRSASARRETSPASKEVAKINTAGKTKPKREIVATYDYTDADGQLTYQVVRFEPKTFGQRRPAGDGAWIWGLDAGEFMRKPGGDWVKFDEKRFEERRYTERRHFDGAVEHGLYRLTDVTEALKAGEVVAIAEGEKDVDNLFDLGIAATTNSGGAKHWSPRHAELFRGARVLIPIDNDKAGRERGEAVAASLKGIAASVRVIDLARHWKEMDEKADVSDWIAQGGTIRDLMAIAKETPDWRPAAPTSKFGAVSWRGIASADAPQHRWLIKNILTEGEVSMLAGAMQSGKTFAALDIAMAVARGTDWFGRRVVRGGVIYQAGEDPTGVRSKRIPAYVREHRMSFDEDLDFTLLTGRLNLWLGGDEQTADFIAECRTISAGMSSPLKLIVIDTYAKSTTGADENNAKEMGIVIARAERIQRETGAAVLLVDHMNADGGRVRGTANKTANIDVVLVCRFAHAPGARRGDSGELLEDANNRRVREITNDIKFGGKNKNGESMREPLRFVLRSVPTGRVDEDGESITSCVVDLPSGDEALKPAASSAKRLNVKYSIALTALKQAIDKRGRAAPESVPADVSPPIDRHGQRTDLCITLADWRDELAPMISEEGEDMAIAKERVRDHLRKTIIPALSTADRRYIRKHGDWIWRTSRRVPGLDYIERRDDPLPATSSPFPEDILEHGF